MELSRALRGETTALDSKAIGFSSSMHEPRLVEAHERHSATSVISKP